MSLVIEKYTRKSYDLEGVRVTAANMEAVAEWCGGEIIQHNGKRCIKVDVVRPLMEKQTRAFVGDWVLKGNGFKVYTNKAFRHCFDKKGVTIKPEDLEQQPDLKAEIYEANRQAALFEAPKPSAMPSRYPEPSTR